jgi:hypothetical protein
MRLKKRGAMTGTHDLFIATLRGGSNWLSAQMT